MVDNEQGVFCDIDDAMTGLLKGLKDESNADVFSKVEAGMPTKIPLYKGPAAIFDLIQGSGTYTFRKKLITMTIPATITILTAGLDTTSTKTNHKLSWMVYKALLQNTHNVMDGLMIQPPSGNFITWGVLPQNRIAVKQGDRAKLYYTGQIFINLDYSGEI